MLRVTDRQSEPLEPSITNVSLVTCIQPMMDEPANNNNDAQELPPPSLTSSSTTVAAVAAIGSEEEQPKPKEATSILGESWKRSPEKILRKLSPPTTYDDHEYDRDTRVWQASHHCRKLWKRATNDLHTECMK